MRSDELKVEIQRAHRDVECDVTGDFALATKAGYFQSSEVVYTTDRVAFVLNGIKMVKTDFFVAITIYWHILKARCSDGIAVLASDSSISLSDGSG